MSDEVVLEGKQKRFLRAMATGLDPLFQVGKAGITDSVMVQVDTALEARELIKLRVLPTAGDAVEEVAKNVADKAGAALIQVVGHNFILFRRSKKKPRIELP